MAVDDWNWRLPAELQDLPWDCAAASLCWCLNSIGLAMTEAEVLAGLGPGRINATYGLLDASGAGLVDYLAGLGVTAENTSLATWVDMTSSAGYQPMLMGGRAWNHWTGVRIGPAAIERPDLDALALANPSPGWMGVGQTMGPGDFSRLGPFSAVWFTQW